MSGLVEYGSSDEEEDTQQELRSQEAPKVSKLFTRSHPPLNGTVTATSSNGHTAPEKSAFESNAPLVGPAMGPPERGEPYTSALYVEDEATAALSPYSANKARIRQLTVPSLPNLDMPDSPPGSPPARTSSKFAHFLQLKKQGVHFNEKLAKSAALKNPTLMQKLMDFADIDEAGQYETTLPREMWNPSGFPEWAFKEELAKAQQTVLKKREEDKMRGQRDSVDFVPATISGDSSRSGTPGPGTSGRLGPKSAAERVMAGLDRSKPTSPAVQAGMKRRREMKTDHWG